eukprot:TRINITY_DN3670_c0_g1_i4.p1 TRINITY_DN3670_c0_g1~~TRINITY_DN3670_c0_g1_i4.p1  ORF type:complete len:278 (-),score=96.33 TRINITY_DN3670_c0_g1_i4:571-1404(-)
MGENNGGDAAVGPPPTKKTKPDQPTVLEQEFDKETQGALEEIDTCQNEIDSLNEKASEEILKVEQKYNKLRKPYFDNRNEIISRIPKFWLTAFINHPQLSTIIEEDEEDALKHLNKLQVEEYEDIKSGFKIKFFFEANPYFENESLTKEYQLDSKGEPTSSSSDIRWKDGYDLTARAAQRAAVAKGAQRKRKLETRTFFTWYSDNEDPANDDVGEIIKDDLWPNPLQYFLVPDLEVDGEESESELEDEEGDNVVVMEEEDVGAEDDEGDGEGEAEEK